MKQCRDTTGPAARRAAQRGVTLMELLVSIAILSLLATVILFGWRVAVSAWERADKVLDQQRRLAAAQRVLAMQMAEMVPVSPWLQEGNAGVFFQGERQTARFVSRYSLANRARSGLTLIEYHILATADGRRQLLLNETPLANPAAAGALLRDSGASAAGPPAQFLPFERTSQTRVLLEGLAEARWEYYRPAGPQGPGGWVAEWPAPAGELPRAMALRLAAPEKDGSLQPVSVVAPVEHFTAARR